MIGDECGAELAPGVTCGRDAGHEGMHMAEGELPPAIGMMVEEIMSHHEREAVRARKARRYYTIFGALWAVSFVANIIATTAGGSVTWLGGFVVGGVVGMISLMVAIAVGARLRAARRNLTEPPTEETL